ncbi:MAG: hypothetical protein AAF492_05545, partial [Verrucomicrobiota bacterium]
MIRDGADMLTEAREATSGKKVRTHEDFKELNRRFKELQNKVKSGREEVGNTELQTVSAFYIPDPDRTLKLFLFYDDPRSGKERLVLLPGVRQTAGPVPVRLRPRGRARENGPHVRSGHSRGRTTDAVVEQ